MIKRFLASSLLVTTFAMTLGCAGREPIQATAAPATQPTIDFRASLYRFDDPRCSADQRRAIRAATKAVIGTEKPIARIVEQLYFTCKESPEVWDLTVWQIGPNTIPSLGGFTGVLLNRDFRVRSVIGGA